MQHPLDSHEPQKTKQEFRGEWLPLCARPQGIHSPRSCGTKKAKKSATRDLRYGPELRIIIKETLAPALISTHP